MASSFFVAYSKLFSYLHATQTCYRRSRVVLTNIFTAHRSQERNTRMMCDPRLWPCSCFHDSINYISAIYQCSSNVLFTRADILFRSESHPSVVDGPVSVLLFSLWVGLSSELENGALHKQHPFHQAIPALLPSFRTPWLQSVFLKIDQLAQAVLIGKVVMSCASLSVESLCYISGKHRQWFLLSRWVMVVSSSRCRLSIARP